MFANQSVVADRNRLLAKDAALRKGDQCAPTKVREVLRGTRIGTNRAVRLGYAVDPLHEWMQDPTLS